MSPLETYLKDLWAIHASGAAVGETSVKRVMLHAAPLAAPKDVAWFLALLRVTRAPVCSPPTCLPSMPFGPRGRRHWV